VIGGILNGGGFKLAGQLSRCLKLKHNRSQYGSRICTGGLGKTRGNGTITTVHGSNGGYAKYI